MKRSVIRVTLIVLLGAVTTVAMAWFPCWSSPLEWTTSGSVENHPRVVAWLDARIWKTDLHGADRPVWVVEERGFGRRRLHLSSAVISGRIPMPADFLIEDAGWPALAFEGYSTPVWTGSAYTFETHALIDLQAIRASMPFQPMWPGFALNTLIYATMWFGLFIGATAGRRAIRRKRGLCPLCGYDLRGDPGRGCPECGWNRSRSADRHDSNAR